jgi:GNAT superfamily N-acetyltransferase
VLQVLQFLQADCPAPLREQIASIVLVEDGLVRSHAAVLRKEIEHGAERYLAFGLSCVVTQPSFRRKGFGRRIVGCATDYMKRAIADLGIFTCDPHLAPFYVFGGWEAAPDWPLIGGTRERPFASDRIGKLTIVRFFSERAKANRETMLSAPIQVDLGEGKLW